jgi:uncharacterized membrane protein YphA (DoxX/SURF4 family)
MIMVLLANDTALGVRCPLPPLPGPLYTFQSCNADGSVKFVARLGVPHPYLSAAVTELPVGGGAVLVVGVVVRLALGTIVTLSTARIRTQNAEEYPLVYVIAIVWEPAGIFIETV